MMKPNTCSKTLLHAGAAKSAFQVLELEVTAAEYRSSKTKLHLKKNDKVTVTDPKGSKEDMRVHYVIGDALIVSAGSFSLSKFLFNAFKSLLF